MARTYANRKMKNFILDVDGVLNTGQMIYSPDRKAFKIFGSEDNDALSLTKSVINIEFVSGDKRGYDITQRRVVKDMGFPLHLVSTFDRTNWLRERYDLKETIYMGDGILDSLVFPHVAYSITTANSFDLVKNYANYVTSRSGGNGAVAEACIHILAEFFNIDNITNLVDRTKNIGGWKK